MAVIHERHEVGRRAGKVQICSSGKRTKAPSGALDTAGQEQNGTYLLDNRLGECLTHLDR